MSVDLKCDCPRLDSENVMHHSTCTDSTPYKSPYPPAPRCFGLSHGCAGKLRYVHTEDEKGMGHDWGDMWYCEKAIIENIDKGFTVKLAKVPK